MIDHIKKYKFRILFEGLVILIFATADLTSQNYFLLFGLFVISIVDFHFHQKLNNDGERMIRAINAEKDKTALRIIKDLSSEIVYPTKTQEWKDGLLDAVSTLEKEIEARSIWTDEK